QPVVSRSSAEAEYRAVANGVAEAFWLRQLLAELHSPLAKSTLVYCGNVSAVYFSTNPVSADEARGDRLTLRARQGRRRRCSGTPCPDHLPVCRHLHQGTTLLDLLGVSLKPQRSRWLVVAAGGICSLYFLLVQFFTPLRR